ncbi:MAG: hypothetical protein D6730_09260 [Bacteroidetes bacterium]|nr:MAG: hypothetical protein D6730_09260 [Bacteroidota bacterium]
MNHDIIPLEEDVSASPLYSEDLAPVPPEKRSWNMWNLAAIWVGMAVCIPTYLLASYMIASGISWYAALIIIGLANLIITVPMVLNGHAGVKYGLPFPVIGRAAFGTRGVHIPAVVRAIVACGWFGVQTWIGGLAFYAIWNVLTGSEASLGLDVGKFVGFAAFWFINVYIIWKGTETIKWLENFAAPILVLIGIVLIVWGTQQTGGFGLVLQQSSQLEQPVATLQEENGQLMLRLNALTDVKGRVKADAYQLGLPTENGLQKQPWQPLTASPQQLPLQADAQSLARLRQGAPLSLQFRRQGSNGPVYSSQVEVSMAQAGAQSLTDRLWSYILWLTAMVGFWATMSISIADITRYAATQKEQVAGQFIGLPGAMILYSFVGIFVTCAAVVNFDDILIAADAPWDPVSLLARFENPAVVIIAQLFMIIATLSTNIAANVIAPANAFSNLFPKLLSFRAGGVVTGIMGILICPWWLLDEISGILVFVSGLLGPVLGILLCDYFVIRKKELQLAELFKTDGVYAFGGSGYNMAALLALAAGVLVALVGYWVPALAFLYNLSWFTGFAVSFFLYWGLMKRNKH